MIVRVLSAAISFHATTFSLLSRGLWGSGLGETSPVNPNSCIRSPTPTYNRTCEPVDLEPEIQVLEGCGKHPAAGQVLQGEPNYGMRLPRTISMGGVFQGIPLHMDPLRRFYSRNHKALKPRTAQNR